MLIVEVMDIYSNELTIPLDETVSVCEDIPSALIMTEDSNQNTSDGESIDIEVDV